MQRISQCPPPAPAPSSQLAGYFSTVRNKRSFILVEGHQVTYHEAGREVFSAMRIEFGEYGVAPEKMSQVSGINILNIKLLVFFDQKNPERRVERFGVVSQDFSQLFFMDDANPSEVNISEKISREEAEEILRSESDPVLCPPGPYRLQPGLEGRLLWISGDPGTGKSASAQALARLQGYVYYEVDCFPKLRNPYIPLEESNPSVVQDMMTPLAGPGCDERREVVESVRDLWRKIVTQQEQLEEEEWDRLGRYYNLLCENIKTERRRIGGDWAVPGCLLHRRIRDFIRANLGPQVVIVVLRMAEDGVRSRILEREPAADIQNILLVRSNIDKILIVIFTSGPAGGSWSVWQH